MTPIVLALLPMLFGPRLAEDGRRVYWLRDDGALITWGEPLDEAPPVVDGAVAVVAGIERACLLDGEGRAHCFGSVDFGCAAEACAEAAEPAPVSYRGLALGVDFGCGVTLAGALACFGVTPRGVSRLTDARSRWVDASLFGLGGCTLDSDGRIGCFGDAPAPGRAPAARIALGAALCALDPAGGLRCLDGQGVDLRHPGPFVSVVAAAHVCALDARGEAWCAALHASAVQAARVPPGRRFRELIAGATGFTCGVELGGGVLCWGANLHGMAAPPVDRPFVHVSTGLRHTCGVLDDGRVVCFGDNIHGQSAPPVGDALMVAAGGDHTCALGVDFEVTCWGDGAPSLPAGPWAAVWHEAGATCVSGFAGGELCVDGMASAGVIPALVWGEITVSPARPRFPALRPPPGPFVWVDAAVAHACGLRGDGTLACWGDETQVDFAPPRVVRE